MPVSKEEQSASELLRQELMKRKLRTYDLMKLWMNSPESSRKATGHKDLESILRQGEKDLEKMMRDHEKKFPLL